MLTQPNIQSISPSTGFELTWAKAEGTPQAIEEKKTNTPQLKRNQHIKLAQI